MAHVIISLKTPATLPVPGTSLAPTKQTNWLDESARKPVKHRLYTSSLYFPPSATSAVLVLPATEKPSIWAGLPVPSVTTVFSMSTMVGMALLFSITSSVAYVGVSPVCGRLIRK